MRKSWVVAAIAAVVASMAAPAAAQCIKESPPHAVALLELYTSEGCNSCPPADRWLSRIAREGPGPDAAVPLAFHVDYWDRLGWKDRFASARFSERQQALARQAGSRAVYTPGVFFNFQEFRGWGSARFDDALRAVNGKPARADIRLELNTLSEAQLALKADFRMMAPNKGHAFVALYENRLSTDVKGGENRGVTLQHDYVVREWIGPIEIAGSVELRRTLALQGDWKTSDLGVAAFVQDAAGREVLQATALAVCVKG
ncbi:MAG TPA: DUF1223 domain-containing protein [Gemmatimonadales bacterium]|jgi:hypothetical protein|nr:DUF1223 domain-containing protein [Gemmatimonadales bacterium]